MSKSRDDEFELKFFEGIAEERPDYVDALIVLAELYTRCGRYKQGLEVDLKLTKLLREDPTVRYNLACSYALLGKTDQALEALMIAVQLGYDDTRHMSTDPDLESLHTHPAFRQLLKTL